MCSDGAGRRWLALPLLAAAAAGLLTIDGGFVYDDVAAIEKNVVVTGQRPAAEAFVRDHWGNPVRQGATNYRPLTPLLWRAQWALGGGSPLPFRLVSLLLHVLAVSVAWWLARRLGLGAVAAAVAATLFALHPLRSEAVGAIVGQSDLLSTALGLFAVGLVLGRRPWHSGLAAAAALLAACLVKESAFVIGLALLAVVAALHRQALARALPCAAVLLAVVAVQAAIPRATGYQHALNNLGYAAEGWQQVLLGFHVVGRSVSMAFLPVGLAPSHGYAAVDLSAATLLPAAVPGMVLTVVGLVLGAIAVARRRPDAVLVLALLSGPAFMQSGLLLDIGTDFAERLLYPSCAAAAGVLTYALWRYVERPALRWAAIATLVLAASIGSWRAQRPWRSEAALWTHAVRAEPLSLRARDNATTIALREGEVAQATWHFLVATYLRQRMPDEVDGAAVSKLERMGVRERLFLAPRAMATDPCPLVHRFLRRSVGQPRVHALARRAWASAYRRCLDSEGDPQRPR